MTKIIFFLPHRQPHNPTSAEGWTDFKGIVNDKILDVPKIGQNERL
jgi:hypothetical protein